MLMRAIPATGEQISVIGLGTWATFDIGDDPKRQREVNDVVKEFVASGGGMIDSSPMYGSAQKAIGRALSALGSRLSESIFSADKVWTSDADGRAQVEHSMKLWGRSMFDLVAVHNLVRVDDHLPMLFDMKAEGKVRYVGVTTYSGKLAREIEQVMRSKPIDAVQLTYNAVDREAEERLLPLAQEKGIAIVANRPFREGALMKRLASKPLPPFAKDIGATSWAQLLLKFIISHAAITCVIPATRSVDHLRDDRAAASGPLPDAKLRDRITEFVRSL